VTDVPITRYAKTADGLHIAYQVVGAGPIDLVFVGTWFSHVDAQWEQPLVERFLRRLASFSRLILFDKRATGASDPVPLPILPTFEAWMDDIVAVVDAVGSDRVALLGDSAGGMLAALFAATYPDRTSSLVLSNTGPRGAWVTGARGWQPEEMERTFGTEDGLAIELTAPSHAGDPSFRSWWARYQRLSSSPAMAAAVWRLYGEADVRAVLPAIRVPTLVLHRRDNRWVTVENGRYFASHIAGAKYVELDGADQWPWLGDAGALVDEIEEFLTGVKGGPEADRVLATVLFTDIVSSTDRAAELGDRRWRNLLDDHDQAVRRQLELYRGKKVKTTGDGALATFDGPARAVRCACAIRDAVRALGLDTRAGLHAGEVEVRGEDIGGIAVHTTARVSALAQPNEVLVSRTVVDLVAGSGIAFADRGEHELKGVPGAWRLYAVVS